MEEEKGRGGGRGCWGGRRRRRRRRRRGGDERADRVKYTLIEYTGGAQAYNPTLSPLPRSSLSCARRFFGVLRV
jgi:hypothetical protein